MDFKSNKQAGFQAAVHPKVQQTIPTQAIKVMITTDDYEIDGFMHIKPGGYQSRISDLLNLKGLHYVPITHATYRSLRNPNEEKRTADTLIIKLDTIKMVVPENGQDHQVPELKVQNANAAAAARKPLMNTGS